MTHEPMNNDVPQPPAPGAAASAQPQSPGCLSALGWLGAGWVLPCFSLNFYSLAARRRAASAMIFFFVFALTITSLQTLALIRGLFQAGAEIRRTFETGQFPEITITGGEAQVEGPQQVVFFEDADTWVAIDTTGELTDIDRQRYRQGFLLTRTTLVVLNNDGRYQKLPLRDVQQALDTDPLIINGDTTTAYWAVFSVIASVIVFVFLIIWNALARLAYIALMALIFWGIAALIRPGTSFGPVLITGLYAVVPALFISFLLSQIQISIPFTTTFFLVVFWGVGLAGAFLPRTAAPASSSVGDYFRAERTLRGWRALIALPLLFDVVLEMIFNWNAWYVTWPLTLITLGALSAVSVWPLIKTNEKGAN